MSKGIRRALAALLVLAAVSLNAPLAAQTQPAVQPGGDIPVDFKPVFAPPGGDIPKAFNPPRGEFQ